MIKEKKRLNLQYEVFNVIGIWRDERREEIERKNETVRKEWKKRIKKKRQEQRYCLFFFFFFFFYYFVLIFFPWDHIWVITPFVGFSRFNLFFQLERRIIKWREKVKCNGLLVISLYRDVVMS